MKRPFLTCGVLFVVLMVNVLPLKVQAAPADYYDTVQRVYVGYYQRPGDPGGLLYWADRLDKTDGNLEEIIDAYANSEESQVLYGTINGNTIGTVIDSIYTGLFNRPSDPGGKAYYTSAYTAGQFPDGRKCTEGTIVLDILGGAQNEDALSITNKLTAANLFTRTIDPELDGANLRYSYSGNEAAQKARNFLFTVTSELATIPTDEEIKGFFGPSQVYNATGTYTWNSATDTLVLTWISSDFLCNGPEIGSEVYTGIAITNTTMTWPDDGMTWSRSSGTAGNPIGIWTATDSGSGAQYIFSVNSDGTMSVTAPLSVCIAGVRIYMAGGSTTTGDVYGGPIPKNDDIWNIIYSPTSYGFVKLGTIGTAGDTVYEFKGTYQYLLILVHAGAVSTSSPCVHIDAIQLIQNNMYLTGMTNSGYTFWGSGGYDQDKLFQPGDSSYLNGPPDNNYVALYGFGFFPAFDWTD